MGILQPYNGHFVNAESASTMLDIEGIFDGCNAVDTEILSMDSLSSKISNVSSYLDTKNFSINGETVLKETDECCENILKVKESILGATSQIRSICEGAYNNLQGQLNYNAQVNDQNEINKMNYRS